MSAVHVKGLKEALVNLDWLIQLVKDKEDDKKIWLIGGYHSKSWQSAKDQIEKEFSTTGGKLKIVIAINALGMAVNYPDVRFIIHCLSPCTSLEGHIQQLGSAGTDGKQAHDITLSANKPLSECAKDVRELFKGKGCLRKGLFKFFDEAEKNSPVDDTQPTRLVNDIDRIEMNSALEEERSKISFHGGAISPLGIQKFHDFPDNLITEVLSKLSCIFTARQVLHLYSLKHARIIFELIQEFFNDIENFDEQIEALEGTERKLEQDTMFSQLLGVNIENDCGERTSSTDDLDDFFGDKGVDHLPELELTF
eukprot:gene10574-11696_t